MGTTATMPLFHPRRIAILLCVAIACVYAEKHAASIATMSVPEIEDKLQECPLVQDLNTYKLATSPQTSSLTSRIFSILFPSTPAVNALLATLYISGPPNFLLALCPPNIDPSSLSVMVAFAVGGLLGDTLFHLLPEIFLGEDAPEHVRFVLVEPNRNLLLGVAIVVGFVTFVAMDKGLRIATGGEGGHDHSHGGHGHGEVEVVRPVGKGSALELENSPAKSTRSRKGKATGTRNGIAGTELEVLKEQKDKDKEINASVKLAGYLNLIADFTHNITDGLAMSSSFYASPTIGATTTVAVFIQSGFSKRQAMGAQFLTALGALLGTVIGIAVQEYGGSGGDGAGGRFDGLMGTSLSWGDMLLPFTAGTFLYVGTVAVIPELLETGKDKVEELKKTLVQFAAVALGAGIMLYI